MKGLTRSSIYQRTNFTADADPNTLLVGHAGAGELAGPSITPATHHEDVRSGKRIPLKK